MGLKAVWSEFGKVQLPRTPSNHFDEGGSRPEGQFGVNSGRFDCTEPPRNTMTRGDELTELTRTFAVDLLPPSSEWFDEVR